MAPPPSPHELLAKDAVRVQQDAETIAFRRAGTMKAKALKAQRRHMFLKNVAYQSGLVAGTPRRTQAAERARAKAVQASEQAQRCWQRYGKLRNKAARIRARRKRIETMPVATHPQTQHFYKQLRARIRSQVERRFRGRRVKTTANGKTRWKRADHKLLGEACYLTEYKILARLDVDQPAAALDTAAETLGALHRDATVAIRRGGLSRQQIDKSAAEIQSVTATLRETAQKGRSPPARRTKTAAARKRLAPALAGLHALKKQLDLAKHGGSSNGVRTAAQIAVTAARVSDILRQAARDRRAASFWAWVRVVARNTAIDVWRKEAARRKRMEEQADRSLADSGGQADFLVSLVADAAHCEQARRIIVETWSGLSRRQQCIACSVWLDHPFVALHRAAAVHPRWLDSFLDKAPRLTAEQRAEIARRVSLRVRVSAGYVASAVTGISHELKKHLRRGLLPVFVRALYAEDNGSSKKLDGAIAEYLDQLDDDQFQLAIDTWVGPLDGGCCRHSFSCLRADEPAVLQEFLEHPTGIADPSGIAERLGKKVTDVTRQQMQIWDGLLDALADALARAHGRPRPGKNSDELQIASTSSKAPGGDHVH